MKSAKRHGKYLLVNYKKEENLFFHFGMTGKFKYFKEDEEAPKYSKLLFNFSNGDHLAYICPRKLGRFGLSESIEDFLKDKKLGPDALDDDLKFQDLKRSSAKAGERLKAAL